MRPRVDRTLVAVAAVVLSAALIRLVGLGTRPFHWDEARVGYWSLRSIESGAISYRPVAGGPLVAHLSRWAIAVGGTADAIARAPFAMLTALLPAVALLFRDRLRKDETIALAIVLAFTPLLVYYGRFLRGDLLAAGAALAVVGFGVRWVDEDRDRDLYAAAAFLAVALASSGFAVATVVLLVAAGALVVDTPRVAGEGDRVTRTVAAGVDWVGARVTPLARSLFVFLGVWGVLFAPRGHGALADPIGFLVGTYREPVVAFLAVRVAGREGTEFLPFLTDAAGTLLATSLPVFGLALLGFLADRYRALPAVDTDRPIVALTGFWAGLGLIAYPVVAETLAPWTLVHAVVPMALPAAVGLAATYRYGRRAFDREDALRGATAVLVLTAVAAGVGIVALDGVYGPSEPGNEFASYGQPASDLEPLVATMNDAIETGDDRVVYVGERYAVDDETALETPPIPTAADRAAFGERLPLAWYVSRTDARVESVTSPAALDGDAPAVLIVDPTHEGTVTEQLPDHEAKTVQLALWDREAVIFIETR